MIASSAVDDSPSQVLPPPGQGSSTLPSYQFIAISNTGSATAFLKFVGDATAVTSSNGIALPAGASMLVDQDDSPIMQNGITAVCASGQSTVVAVQAY